MNPALFHWKLVPKLEQLALSCSLRAEYNENIHCNGTFGKLQDFAFSKKILLKCLFMNDYVSKWHMCPVAQVICVGPKGIRSPGAGVTGGCELSDVASGNRTQVLSACILLSRLSRSKIYN